MNEYKNVILFFLKQYCFLPGFKTWYQKMLNHLVVPTALSFVGELASNWEVFKQKWEFYSVATGASEYESAKRQACLFLHVIGEEAVKVYNNFTFATEEDKFNAARIIEKFDGYCNPKKNETFERYKFFIRIQNNDEMIDHFVNDLRTLSQACNFGPLADSLIRDRLICGILNEHL